MKQALENLISEVRSHLVTLENKAKADLGSLESDITADIDEARVKAAAVLAGLAEKLADV